MRCFACDNSGSLVYDGPTGRHYCSPCMNVIQGMLRQQRERESTEVVDRYSLDAGNYDWHMRQEKEYYYGETGEGSFPYPSDVSEVQS